MKKEHKIMKLEWIRIYLGVTFFFLMLFFGVTIPNVTGAIIGTSFHSERVGWFIFGGLGVLVMFIERRING